jgi:hypothetical protein
MFERRVRNLGSWLVESSTKKAITQEQRVIELRVLKHHDSHSKPTSMPCALVG